MNEEMYDELVVMIRQVEDRLVERLRDLEDAVRGLSFRGGDQLGSCIGFDASGYEFEEEEY